MSCRRAGDDKKLPSMRHINTAEPGSEKGGAEVVLRCLVGVERSSWRSCRTDKVSLLATESVGSVNCGS